MDKEALLTHHTLLQQDYRGKRIIALDGLPAMLKLWALQNTTGKKQTYIFAPDGHCIAGYIGQGKGEFPEVFKEGAPEIAELVLVTEGSCPCQRG